MYTKDRKQKQKHVRILLFFSSLILILAVIFGFPKLTKAAENYIAVKEINYLNSTITLQVNSGDTMVYFSDSLKQIWEIVPGKINNNNTIVMDISWVSLSSNYVMTFKGNYSTGITTVVLPKPANNLKASFNIIKNTVSFSNAGVRPIEWRKRDSMVWNTVNMNTLSTELGYLYTNGATICFRLAPINGTSNIDVGCRASTEVSVIIPKKTAAPSIAINGSKFLITAKKGITYRTKYDDESVTAWETFDSTSNHLLTDIAPNAMYSNNTTAQKEVTLQFRSKATSSAQVSNISTIIVPIQEGPPEKDKCGVNISYTSSTTISLQIEAASSTTPFEYTIVKQDGELNYQTASWTAITSNTAISIKKSVAPQGSHIYIRKKSIDACEGVDYALASVEVDITGTNGLSYPETPKETAITTLITPAGVCNEGNKSGYLTFTLYNPTKTTVSSIDFYNAYGNKKGSVTCKSSVTVNSNSTGTIDKYIITTNITSTSNIDTITNEILYAYITFANSDTITSTSTTGIHLYMYPNTTVNNPSSTYTNEFKRIYLSNDEDDASNFKFRLDLGTDKVIDTSAINHFTTVATAVNSILYNGYRLNKDTDYSIEYGSYVRADDITIATATVTVNVDVFESSIPISKLDQKMPMIIELNNKEILADDIYITLVSTATMKNIPISWSISEGSLKETKASTKTNTDGSTTTVTEEVISYIIDLTLFDNSYEVSISDVTWGDLSILGSASVTAGKATIYLSNAKINKLVTNSTDTKNIVITLSNGFVIGNGCKLTIIKSS